jgi:hypothetical protein
VGKRGPKPHGERRERGIAGLSEPDSPIAIEAKEKEKEKEREKEKHTITQEIGCVSYPSIEEASCFLL